MVNTVPNNSPPNPSRFRKREVAPAPRVEWDAWYDNFKREWKQDEHVTIIGPTGTGKTALTVELVKIRSFTVYVVTKPSDPKLEAALARQDYVRVPAFPKAPPPEVDRYLLWPPGSGEMTPEAHTKQRTIIRDAFNKIFRGPRGGLPGRWCIILDEARYVADPAYLGLRREVNQLLIQGRSLRIAVVLNFQRPAWVPAEAYDQASHLFIAADNDRRNLQRFREIGGVDGEIVAATVQGLGLYEWAHVDARPGKGTVVVVKMPRGL
jgi:energy-coupling factor transporter ATP-binding protein EcfA2